MAILPLSIARVSAALKTSVATQSLNTTQSQLLQAENELSTGKTINTPSDNPAGAETVLQLNQTLSNRQAYSDNLNRASTQLSQVDNTLGSLETILQQAQSTASANVGSDVTDAQRQGAAATVDSLYSQLLSVGNTELSGQYLFAGDKSDQQPFVEADGTVQYVGSTNLMSNQFDENTTETFQVNGSNVFGALTSQIDGTANLSPTLTTATRISDLAGATGAGVSLGAIQIANGTTSATVNLSGSDTIADVIAKINAAGVGGITASIGSSGNLVLSGAAGDDITVKDVGGGTTAEDLGILKTTAAGVGVADTGTSVGAKITTLTPLADLKNGAGIDLSSGITITNGQKSATLQFSSPPLRAGATVEDLINAVNSSGTNVTVQINAAGTGLNFINTTQGTNLSISENGGTTASDLGVRNFSANTLLSQLNSGAGVKTAGSGTNDIQIADSAGKTFQVSITGDTTIQDVVNSINTAATAAGAGVTAGFSTKNNGITLTDTAGGAGTLTLTAINASEAAKDLGLTATAQSGVITGTDVNAVASNSIFGNMAKLKTALENNDQAGITAAAQALQNDYNRVVSVRGANGAKLKEFQDRTTQLSDQNTATQSLLSNTEDADYTKVISKFESLQTAMQAGLEAAAKTMQLSLMDFLG
ncbi:MAG: flagellar hook-associated protein FlgL [Phycisphaerae bacterium]|nr:flagellar hook-associated protein FlgL [Phycisphaerae bacterium]